MEMGIEVREILYILAVGMCVGSVLFCNRTMNLQQKLLNALHEQIDILDKTIEIQHDITQIIDSRLGRVEDIAFPTRADPNVH